uniref:Uncharacterized protein n=1 Tax=Magallana gigas TaxID=29159 RepID=K1PEL0_MAGGI
MYKARCVYVSYSRASCTVLLVRVLIVFVEYQQFGVSLDTAAPRNITIFQSRAPSAQTRTCDTQVTPDSWGHGCPPGIPGAKRGNISTEYWRQGAE